MFPPTDNAALYVCLRCLLPQMDMAYIEIQTLRSGWRAGQHVRLRVFSMGMGLLGWTESHPFTIASASEGTDGLVLLCRRAGNWTGKLVDLAKKLDGEFEGNQGEVRIWVEGPFGGPSRMVFAGYSAVVLTVGGSGITFGLSIMEELLSMDRRHQSRVKYIELVWVVPEAGTRTSDESRVGPLTDRAFQQPQSSRWSSYSLPSCNRRTPRS